VITWLPPQYHDRRYAKISFPVVMVLGGADGTSGMSSTG
jgi:hypothetical protein